MMRFRAGLMLAACLAVSACSEPYWSGEGVVSSAGDAPRANAILHRTPDATAHSHVVHVPADGVRSADAIRRYRGISTPEQVGAVPEVAPAPVE